jgi:hypothetical protein
MIGEILLISAVSFICVFLVAVLVGIGIVISDKPEILDEDDENF